MDTLLLNMESQNLIVFAPIWILNISVIIVSMILMKSAFSVLCDVLYVSHTILNKKPGEDSNDVIVLDFNHCRFINQNAIMQKRHFNSLHEEFFEHLKCLKLRFFFSVFGYIVSFYQALIIFIAIFQSGIVQSSQLLVIAFSIFLSISDMSTIFVTGSKFNLLTMIIQKQMATFFEIIFGFLILFFLFSLIIFHLYGFYTPFSTLRMTAITLIGILNGDGVKDLMDMVIESPILIILNLIFIIMFFMGFIPIIYSMMTIGFQKARARIVKTAHLRAQRMMEVRNKASTIEKKYKKIGSTRENLLSQFKEDYEDKIELLAQLSKIRSIKNNKDPENKEFRRTNTWGSELAESEDINPETEMVHLRDDMSLSLGGHIERFDQHFNHPYHSLKVSIFDLIIHTENYGSYVERLVSDIHKFREEKKFSFVIHMACSGAIDGFLTDIPEVQMKIMEMMKGGHMELGF